MNATAVDRRKGMLSGLTLPRITAATLVAAAVLILVGVFLGFLLGDYLFGYGAIGTVDVIVSDSTGGAVPTSLGSFQVHKVESWFGWQGNRVEFTVTRGPLQ